MDLEKLKPWNWFRHEDEQTQGHVPVQRSEVGNPRHAASPLTRLHDELDRAFDRTFDRTLNDVFASIGMTRTGSGLSGMQRPNMDVSVHDDSYHISMDAPGLKREDVDVSIRGNALIIRGERKDDREQKDRHYHRVERYRGSFQRVLTLPEDADTDSVEASLDNGELDIRIRRRADAVTEAKRIDLR